MVSWGRQVVLNQIDYGCTLHSGNGAECDVISIRSSPPQGPGRGEADVGFQDPTLCFQGEIVRRDERQVLCVHRVPGIVHPKLFEVKVRCAQSLYARQPVAVDQRFGFGLRNRGARDGYRHIFSTGLNAKLVRAGSNQRRRAASGRGRSLQCPIMRPASPNSDYRTLQSPSMVRRR